jgi:hypothetical protein
MGKNIPKRGKLTKNIIENIPNDHKMYQIAINYTI